MSIISGICLENMLKREKDCLHSAKSVAKECWVYCCRLKFMKHARCKQITKWRFLMLFFLSSRPRNECVWLNFFDNIKKMQRRKIERIATTETTVQSSVSGLATAYLLFDLCSLFVGTKRRSTKAECISWISSWIIKL